MIPTRLQHYEGSDMLGADYGAFAPAYRPHSVSSTRERKEEVPDWLETLMASRLEPETASHAEPF